MSKFQIDIERNALLSALQHVVGVVGSNKTMPILSQVLLRGAGKKLTVVGSDKEIEMKTEVPLVIGSDQPWSVAVAGLKLLEVCRNLPQSSSLRLTIQEDGRVLLQSGRSRFVLAAMSGDAFPLMAAQLSDSPWLVSQEQFVHALKKVAFSMAAQDIRHFLNGVLVEVSADELRFVATDGHRLACCSVPVAWPSVQAQSAILPRKAAQELQRVLERNDSPVRLFMDQQQFQLSAPHLSLMSLLIEGRYPNYQKAIPSSCDCTLAVDRDALREALQRIAILSTQEFRGLRMTVAQDEMVLLAHNPEEEQVEERVAIDYSGGTVTMGFNVRYLQDIMSVLDSSSTVHMHFSMEGGGVIIDSPAAPGAMFVVMQMTA